MNQSLVHSHIQAIYDSVTKTDGLDLLMNQIVTDLEFRTGLISFDNIARQQIIERINIGYTDSQERDMRSHFCTCDVWTADLWKQKPQFFHITESFVPQPTFKKSEFYNDFCKAADISHATGMSVYSKEGTGLRVSFHHTHTQGSLIEKQPHLNLLAPHLCTAINLRHEFFELKGNQSGITSIVDTLQFGALLADETGKVLYANQYAEQLFEQRQEVGLSNNQITFKPPFQSRFLKMLQSAIGSAQGDFIAPTNRMHITADIDNQSAELEVHVQPMSSYESMFGFHTRKPLALVYIKKINFLKPLNNEILQHLFDLSDKEIDLATRLVNGQSIQQAAVDTHRSINTIKTQLRSLFRKTDTNTQAQLIARLSSSLASAQSHH